MICFLAKRSRKRRSVSIMGGGQAMRVTAYGFVAVPLALVCYLIAATPIAGEPTTSPSGLREAIVKVLFYTVIAILLLAPPALGSQNGWYNRFLASRPMVWIGEISYEIFLVHLIVMELAMVEVLRRPVYTGSTLQLFIVTMALTPLFASAHSCHRRRTQSWRAALSATCVKISSN